MSILRFGLCAGFAFIISEHVWGQPQPVPNTTPPPLTVEIKPIQVFHRERKSFFIDFSPDGKLMVSGGDKHVHIWDLGTGKQIAEYAIEDRNSTFIARFSPDGQTLACTAGNGQIVFLLETGSGKVLQKYGPHPNGVREVLFTSDVKNLVTVCSDDVLRMWDLGTGKERKNTPWDKLDGEFSSAAISADGKCIAIGVNDTLHVLEMNSGKEVCHFPRCKDPSRTERDLTFSPNGRYLAVGSTHENEIRLWDLVQKELATTIAWETAPEPPSAKPLRPIRHSGLDALTFSGDGRTLVAACCDQYVRVWEVNTGGLRYQAEESTPTVATAPGRALLATASIPDGAIRVWDGVNPGRAQSRQLKPEQIDRQWAALEGLDAESAYQAIVSLVTAPEEAVTAIGRHLAAVKPVDDAKIDQLIANLDDNDFATRKAALEQLRLLEHSAKPKLRSALDKGPSVEVRDRLQTLLDELKGRPQGALLRSLRAIELLECVGTPEARLILKELGQGAPGALLTDEANAALKRMGTGKLPRPGTKPRSSF
jgi:WD domain, G-beta repeat